MRHLPSLALFSYLAASLTAAPTDDVYQHGPDSLPQPGVPQGIVGE